MSNDTASAGTHNTDPLFTPAETAEYVDATEGTLSVWRSTGRYNLPFVKIGSKVRYRQSDLDAWLKRRTRESGVTA
jgi:excisionase family DNA binding protein